VSVVVGGEGGMDAKAVEERGVVEVDVFVIGLYLLKGL
jgi:hypothetical protein